MKFVFMVFVLLPFANLTNAAAIVRGSNLGHFVDQPDDSKVTLVRNDKRRHRQHNPYYYQPGLEVPYLSNPYPRSYSYNYPNSIVCYSQSYDGRLYWGSGLSIYEASYNAGSICTRSTGYMCYAAGCRYAY